MTDIKQGLDCFRCFSLFDGIIYTSSLGDTKNKQQYTGDNSFFWGLYW